MYHEAARYANHLCQIIWSLNFASRLGNGELSRSLKEALLTCGRDLDMMHASEEGAPSTGAPKLPKERSSCDPIKEPELPLQLRGVAVVLKPPNWEVDAKGQLSSSGYHLSHFMQRACHRSMSKVLMLAEFEYGFIHRLDVPSSGLILTGTHFEGYSLLQWQIHTYTIGREYSVLVGCLIPSTLRDINASINDFLPGHSFVDESQGRPAETHLKCCWHVWRRLRFSCERFGLVCIAIHTGRRHQIRVHMQWEGHPTVTDEKYAHRALFLSSFGLEAHLTKAMGSIVVQ